MESTALERTRGRETDGRHACAGTPSGIAIVEERDGWRIAFARSGTVWRRAVTHCPWCGAKLGDGEAEPAKPRKGRSRACRIRCVETGETFATQHAAAKAVGVDQGCVSSAMRKGHRAGGFHWERA